MKKTLFIILLSIIGLSTYAQGGFNYKAVLTDNGTALQNQSIDVRFTILQNGTTSVYQETQQTTTDDNGIISLSLGEGSIISGSFTNINWENAQFLKVEIDTGNGYQDFGTSELKYVPYAKYADKAGNVFSGNFTDLSNVPSGLSDGDDDTHLTETQVDNFVANNGYLTQVDNIQGIPVSNTTPNNGQVLKFNGTQFVPADDDVSGGSGTDGVVNSAAFSGTATKTLTLARSNGLGNITANFTDNDTHLTDANIGAMGYIKNADDADADATNELQTISKTGNTVTLSNGGGSFTDADTHLTETQVDSYVANNGYLTSETDGSTTNELQTISKSGNTVTLSNGGGSFTDADTHLTDANIGAMGYIKNANDADADTTNELQTISKSGNTVTLSNGGGSFTDADTHLTDANIGAMGYIKNADDADADTTNELQTLTLSSTQLSISNGNNVNFTGWDTNAADDFSGNYNDLTNQPVLFYENGTTDPGVNTTQNISRMGSINLGSSFNNVADDALFRASIATNSIDNAYGVGAIIGGTGNGEHYGSYNYLTGAGTGMQIGNKNEIDNSGDGYHLGNYSHLSGGDGNHYGSLNELFDGSGDHAGTFNILSGSGNGEQVGYKARIDNTGNGFKIGNLISIESDTGFQVGFYANIHTDTSEEKIGNYTSLNGSGDGEQYGYLSKLRGSGNGKIYAVADTISNSGDGQQFGVYNYLNGSGIGVHFGSGNLLSGDGEGMQCGSWNNVDNSGDGRHYGSVSQLDGDGTGRHYGTVTSLSGSGSGKQYGTSNFIDNTGNSNHYGSFSELSGAGEGEQYGTLNTITNTGDANHYGSFSELSGTGSGDHSGAFNTLTGTGTGAQYGVQTFIDNSGDATHYGNYSKLSGMGSGIHYGTYNSLSGAGTGQQYGTLNTIYSSGGAVHYGEFNRLSGVGTGAQFGSSNIINNSGDATHYGTYSELSGSGTGDKYASYNKITTTAGGTHYAVYGEAEKSGSYAGYFKGDVYTTQKIKAPVSGNTDMKAFIYGDVSSNGLLYLNGSSDGFSVAKNSTGVYTVTFDTNVDSSNEYIVVATTYSNLTPTLITVSGRSTSSFKLYSWNLSGAHTNAHFHFVVYKK